MKSLGLKYLIFLITCTSSTFAGFPQDIALHKSYTLSANSDDPYGVSPNDRISLTDGIYTSGVYFWSQKTTNGWAQQVVTITIDLSAPQPVGAVIFNTVRFDKQNVYFPANIYIFLSNDNLNYKYLGDAADTSINQPGDYKLQTFAQSNLNTFARYVRLIVIPKGTQIYCDEIQVLKSTALNNEILSAQLMHQNMLNDVIDSLKKIDFIRHNIKRNINSIRSYRQQSGTAPSAMLASIDSKLRNKNLSYKELTNLKSSVTKELTKNMKASGDVNFIISKYNPWDTLSELFIPKKNIKPTYSFVVPVNGIQYGSFLITNTSKSVEQLQITKHNASPSLIKLDVFNALFVPTENYKEVADPILKVGANCEIQPGQTAMLLFKLTGLDKGIARADIEVNRSGQSKVTLPIAVTLSSIGLGKKSALNALVWSYFYYPSLKDRVPQAMADLLAHRINTNVIPPNSIPPLTEQDFHSFLSYISKVKGADNILIYMNYGTKILKNGYEGGQFMSDDWQQKFKAWYSKIMKDLIDSGFQRQNIYLYPFDEVHDKDIFDFHDFIVWAKKNIPGIQFYATLANAEAIRSMLPIVDIAQIQSNYLGLEELPAHTCQVWLYSGSAPARDLSPYSFYRLMSWQAFANQFLGVGFWNYANEGVYTKLALIDAPLIYPTASFSVIYDGPNNSITSTRRWEAFLLGIQDYDLLSLYAKRFGKDKAIDMAKQVNKLPDNVHLADSVCNEIIKALSSGN